MSELDKLKTNKKEVRALKVANQLDFDIASSLPIQRRLKPLKQRLTLAAATRIKVSELPGTYRVPSVMDINVPQ